MKKTNGTEHAEGQRDAALAIIEEGWTREDAGKWVALLEPSPYRDAYDHGFRSIFEAYAKGLVTPAIDAFTCDCGDAIDRTTGVSMCRGCFDSRAPAPAGMS